MMLESALDSQRSEIAVLQEIIRAEHQRRRRAPLGRHAMREMPSDKAGLASAR